MAPERRVTNSDGVGDVFVWGSNETGVLGLTTAATRRKRPFPVALLDKSSPSGYKRLLPRCSHVAAGGVHSVAVTPEGALFTWGVGDEGQLARHVSREDVEGPAKPERVAMPTGAGAVVRVAADDTAERVAIDIIASAEAWLMVREGELAVGDRLVVRGNERLRPGQALLITDAAPPATEASDAGTN